MRKFVERVGEGLHDAFEFPFKGKDIVEKDTLILPPGIREALRTRPEANITKEELKDFLKYSDFVDQGVYLVSKILDSQPELQRDFLAEFVSIEEKNPDDTAVLQEILIRFTDQTPDDQEVQAGKLAQISRQGFYNWSDWYESYAGGWDEKFGEDTVPVLAAYSTLGGMKRFVNRFKESQKKFIILMPGKIESEDSEFCGYQIDPSAENLEDRVIPIKKDFERPINAVILDETTTTGNSLRGLKEFWEEGMNEGSRVEAIGMVKGDPAAKNKTKV